jgi:hypothetical protein
MIRILLLHPRDWLEKNASYMESYLHEILVRIAARGHYVAWLCGRRGAHWPNSTGPNDVEVADGIQMARLGSTLFHRPLVRLFLEKLAKTDKYPFDVVINCVNGRGLQIEKVVRVPILPLAFSVKGGERALGPRTGPVVAATRQGVEQLQATGVPAGHIVYAPLGADAATEATRKPKASGHVVSMARIGGWRLGARAANRMAARLAAHGVTISDITRAADGEDPWVAYCGKGHEWDALAFAGRGIPTICPDTPEGRECVVAEETGLLHAAGDFGALERQIERIAGDEVLYRRLSEGAAKFASQRSWDRSAGLVLGAIENLVGHN